MTICSCALISVRKNRKKKAFKYKMKKYDPEDCAYRVIDRRKNVDNG